MEDKANEPTVQYNNDFLARLGLSGDPFPAVTDTSLYHENPDLMQRLDMIQHLIGFSNQMIFVTGEKGIGKTSMLDRLEYYAPDHWRICHIQANPMLNTPAILEKLIEGFGLELTANSNDMFQVYSDALQEHIETLERAMLTPVVLIDDAHELPVDVFILLFGLIQQDSGKSHLKITLFCEPDVIKMLDSPQLKVLSQNLTHQLEIPYFNEQQTTDYLTQRLNHAGLTSEFPFKPETLKSIYRDSDGLAGKIHMLAQQALLDENAQIAQTEGAEPTAPVVDEVLEFEQPGEAAFPSMSSRTQTSGEPLGKKFQTWQIGAVAGVLALLAGLVWLTSQFSNPQPSIAEELPLAAEQADSDNSDQIMAQAEPSYPGLDPSLFEQPSLSIEDVNPADEEELAEQNDQEATQQEEANDAVDKNDLQVAEPQAEEKELADTAPVDADNANPDEAKNDEVLNELLSEQKQIESNEVKDPLDEFVEVLEQENKAAAEQTTADITAATNEPKAAQTQENKTAQAEQSKPEQSKVESVAEKKEDATKKLVEQQIEKIKDDNGTEAITKNEGRKKLDLDKIEERSVSEKNETKADKKDDQKTDKPEKAANVTKNIAGVKNADWLRQQNSQQVVLQLLGTHDQFALKKMVSENKLGNDTAWFTTIHNGEPWYVLVKGPYKDRASASSSINTLPVALKERKPWPRTMGDVKKAMEKAPQ